MQAGAGDCSPSSPERLSLPGEGFLHLFPFISDLSQGAFNTLLFFFFFFNQPVQPKRVPARPREPRKRRWTKSLVPREQRGRTEQPDHFSLRADPAHPWEAKEPARWSCCDGRGPGRHNLCAGDGPGWGGADTSRGGQKSEFPHGSQGLYHHSGGARTSGMSHFRVPHLGNAHSSGGAHT